MGTTTCTYKACASSGTRKRLTPARPMIGPRGGGFCQRLSLASSSGLGLVGCSGRCFDVTPIDGHKVGVRSPSSARSRCPAMGPKNAIEAAPLSPLCSVRAGSLPAFPVRGAMLPQRLLSCVPLGEVRRLPGIRLTSTHPAQQLKVVVSCCLVLLSRSP